VKVRRVATHVDQTIDGAQGLDQLFVCHSDAIAGRVVGSSGKWRTRRPLPNRCVL
jgi:hypothetical protein